MTVFVLIREDQNQHGYVDTSITGVYQVEHSAQEQRERECRAAREQGMIVEDDESPDAEWEVCWRIEEHVVM